WNRSSASAPAKPAPMRSNPTRRQSMKTRHLSGWKTRWQAVLFATMCGIAVLVSPAANAQEEAPPVETAAAIDEAPAPAVIEETVVEDIVAEAAPAEGAAAEPTVDKGDVAWMLTSTLLVLLMTVPGLALFYGGMVRSKNVLSVLIQVMLVFSVLVLLWVGYGYSLAFAGGNAVLGSFDKLFLAGVGIDSLADTFTATVKVPEYAFIAFQATFAGITGALIVGAFAERIRLSALMLFAVLWFSFGYLPIAHMVWGPGGYLLELGALEFAGGTVVHVNAGVAGLVGAYFLGKRLGFGREAIKPHNVTMTFVGASLLWVGWFGFNAGSNLQADAGAALAFINTLLATAAAMVAWATVEMLAKGKPSAL